MTIDPVSTNFITIALYINSLYPGFVSELWIDKELQNEIKGSLPTQETLARLIATTKEQVQGISDARRKEYLSEMLDSLVFQLEILNKSDVSFSEFSRHAYGFEMKRVTSQEISKIEKEIRELEKGIGLSRLEVFQKHSVAVDNTLALFQSYIQEAKESVPAFITDFPDKGFSLELVTNKAWSAFNSHEAPFTSRLMLNTDTDLNELDLYHLAFHEAYGGHHSELSQKDKLLLEGKGEHGLVITFSPQTFISEAIAEGIYSIYQNKSADPEFQLLWNYNRLIFALQNLATHLFFDDKKTKDQVSQELEKYYISEKACENILNFSTDPLFGRYAPVYYSAYDFFEELYLRNPEKEVLIKKLFTSPCTPKLLLEEFRSSRLS